MTNWRFIYGPKADLYGVGAKDQSFGKRKDRAKKPIEQKESHKWLKSFRQVAWAQKQCPDTLLVSVGDREADLYELFARAAQDPAGPKLLIRAEYGAKTEFEEMEYIHFREFSPLLNARQAGHA